jgi:hypothetical protein
MVRMTKEYIATGLCVLLLLTAGVFWGRKLNDARQFAKIIDRTYAISDALQAHVSDKGGFPPNLEMLVKEGKLPAQLVQPMAGEDIHYLPPDGTSPPETPVLVVTLRSKRMMVSKNFKATITMEDNQQH